MKSCWVVGWGGGGVEGWNGAWRAEKEKFHSPFSTVSETRSACQRALFYIVLMKKRKDKKNMEALMQCVIHGQLLWSSDEQGSPRATLQLKG